MINLFFAAALILATDGAICPNHTLEDHERSVSEQTGGLASKVTDSIEATTIKKWVYRWNASRPDYSRLETDEVSRVVVYRHPASPLELALFGDEHGCFVAGMYRDLRK